MRPEAESTRLINDIVEDSLPAEFSGMLLEDTLRQVRTKRKHRLIRQSIAGTSLLVVALLIGVPISDPVNVVSTNTSGHLTMIGTHPGTVASVETTTDTTAYKIDSGRAVTNLQQVSTPMGCVATSIETADLIMLIAQRGGLLVDIDERTTIACLK